MDVFERFANELEQEQIFRCKLFPPQTTTELQAEARMTESIEFLRGLSQTYNSSERV